MRIEIKIEILKVFSFDFSFVSKEKKDDKKDDHSNPTAK